MTDIELPFGPAEGQARFEVPEERVKDMRLLDMRTGEIFMLYDGSLIPAGSSHPVNVDQLKTMLEARIAHVAEWQEGSARLQELKFALRLVSEMAIGESTQGSALAQLGEAFQG